VLDFEFNSENVLGRVIMRPEAFRDTLAELDMSSSTLRIDITTKAIVFATDGEQGKVTVGGGNILFTILPLMGWDQLKSLASHLYRRRETNSKIFCSLWSLKFHCVKFAPCFQTTIPSHSDVIDKFECRDLPVSNVYRLSLMKRIKNALALAQKMSMRVDTRGVLSMQFMVENKEHQVKFIEVYVS
jgi:hypothetical protein